MCFGANAKTLQLIMYILSWIIRSVKGWWGGVGGNGLHRSDSEGTSWHRLENKIIVGPI